MAKVRLWFDRPQPKDWPLSSAEWDWHCYRMKGRFEADRRRLEERKPADNSAGATAGWRKIGQDHADRQP